MNTQQNKPTPPASAPGSKNTAHWGLSESRSIEKN